MLLFKVYLRKHYSRNRDGLVLVVEGWIKVEAQSKRGARVAVRLMMADDPVLQTIDPRIRWRRNAAERNPEFWDYMDWTFDLTGRVRGPLKEEADGRATAGGR